MKTEEILSEREETHGDFGSVAELHLKLIDTFERYSRWDKVPVIAMEALSMICLKMSRIANGDPHFSDHWDDIAGYAMLGKGKRVIRQEDMPPTAHVGEKFLFEGGKFGPVDEKQWSRDCGHSPVMRTYSKASEVEKGVRTTCFFWICNDCGHLYIHDIKQNNVDISKMETTE